MCSSDLSADASDTEGPTDNSTKTGSMDKSRGSSETLAQCARSRFPSETTSITESFEKPQIQIRPCDIEKGMDTPIEPLSALAQPRDLLMKDTAKRLVHNIINDSSRLIYYAVIF